MADVRVRVPGALAQPTLQLLLQRPRAERRPEEFVRGDGVRALVEALVVRHGGLVAARHAQR